MEKKLSKRQQHKLVKNPYVGAIVMALWSIVFLNLFTALNFTKNETVGYIVSIIAGILLMLIHKIWFREEYDGSFTKSGLTDKNVNMTIILTFVATFLIAILPEWLSTGANAPNIDAFLHGMSAGVIEEAMCRALMVSVMMRAFNKPEDVKKPVIFTAILFGAIHIFNILKGADVGATFVQMLSAAAGGAFFAAVFLRTGNVLYTILFHGIYDMMCMMQKGSESGVLSALAAWEIIITIVHAAVLVAVTVYLIRNHEEEITELWNMKWSKNSKAQEAEKSET